MCWAAALWAVWRAASPAVALHNRSDTNSSDVFGNRYVGGIVSVNGSNSIISHAPTAASLRALAKMRPTSAAS